MIQAQQIATRYNNKKLIQEISNEQQYLINHLELWEQLKDSEAPLSERFKLTRINEQIERINRANVLIPTQILDDKVAIHKETKICLVCRDEVARFSYICDCGAIYCGNCAQALTELENVCWVCDGPIDFSKSVKPYKEDEKVEIQEKSKMK